MANIITNNIDIVCDDATVLNDIMEKYTTNGGLDFNKICPIPDDLHIPEPFSSTLVKALSDYLSIINPRNKKYKDDPFRQKYATASYDEMQDILNKLKRYGDPGLINILRIDSTPMLGKAHLADALNDEYPWLPSQIKTIDDWIEWGRSYVVNIYKYGAPNSNMWAERHWGTEGLGTTISECKIVDDVLTTRIQTRWDPPHKILIALSRLYPDCRIFNKYKSEFWRGYLQAVYYGGEMADDIKI